MKILVVGEYKWEIYEKPLSLAFQALGYDVSNFGWNKYFESTNIVGETYLKFQNKYHVGPTIHKINSDLLISCRQLNPDLVFIYRGVVIYGSTIRKIRKNGAIVIGYNNDDPFDTRYRPYVYSIYLHSIKDYNYIFSYRTKNIQDYCKCGIRSELLRSYYIEERNYYIPSNSLPSRQYECDVMFIGHYEDDGRDEYLRELVVKNISFSLYGDGWNRSEYADLFKSYMGDEIKQIRDDYNLALNSCKIALVFLSKLNNDTYTRRCFEIPATKRMMLCEYTDDLASLFTPDKEAVYFSNKEDFINKITYYLIHNEERKKIAEEGYRRLINDGHEIKDRAKQIIEKYKELRNDNNKG